MWTLTSIISAVRGLSGQESVTGFSDEAMTAIINEFYVNMLPNAVYSQKFDGFYDIATVIATTDYAMPSGMMLKDPAWYFNNGVEYQIRVFSDPKLFFSAYPIENSTPGEPGAVMIHGGIISVRPEPDAIYTLKFTAKVKPAELVDGTDTLLDDAWGRYVAYGAAILILEAAGDFQESNRLSKVAIILKSNINSNYTITRPAQDVIRSF